MKTLICLGIETTAHTFGVGIVDSKGKIFANVKDSYSSEHTGIIPYQAAEHHYNVAVDVIKEALKKANLSPDKINLISFSQGPGMGPSLRVGAIAARTLALKYKLPLIGVNHCIAHLEIGKLVTKAKDPVLLYASGANTQIIAFEAGKYRIFGESLDIGVGNFLDSFARHIGLGFPGGPKIYELSLKSKNYIELPYVVKGMDISLGGLLTNLKQKFDSKKYKVEDLCYSAQETVFAMLLEVSERAMAHCEKKELLLGGGVCCNKRLQEMAKLMCKDRNAECFVPTNDLLVDNGAMISWLGIVEFNKRGATPIKNSQILPYWRTDQV